jgi:hypothetical protein
MVGRLEETMASPTFDGSLALLNQFADFQAARVGNAFVALDRLGDGLIAFTPNETFDEVTRDDIAHYVLVGSLVVEIIGLVVAAVGITLPKVSMAKFSMALLNLLKNKETRRRFLRAFSTLMGVLENAQASVADKAEAILVFLRALQGLGMLSRLLAELISEWDWEDFLRIGLGLAVTIGATLATGGAATAIKIAVALGSALLEIVNKVDELIDRSEQA